MKIDLNKVTDLEFDGLNDWPDMANLYIEAGLLNGEPMTDEQMDYLQDAHSSWVYDQAINQIF